MKTKQDYINERERVKRDFDIFCQKRNEERKKMYGNSSLEPVQQHKNK